MQKWNVTAAERPSGHWRHQDRHIVQVLEHERIVIAVIDGHGESDETITRCMDILPERLKRFGEARIRADETLRDIILDLGRETAGYEDGASISLAYLSVSGHVALATYGDTFACAGCLGTEAIRLEWLRPHEVSGNAAELKRLKDAGANVNLGKLHSPGGHELSLSRSLGDRMFRDQMVPGVATLFTQVEPPGFVILGTDGYFSVSQPEFIEMRWLACVEERMDAKEILNASYHVLRSRKDDATVVVAYTEPV